MCFRHSSDIFVTQPVHSPTPPFLLTKQWFDVRVIWNMAASCTQFPVAWFRESLFRSKCAAAVPWIFHDLSVSGVSWCSETCHVIDRLWHKGMLHEATGQKHKRHPQAWVLLDFLNFNCSRRARLFPKERKTKAAPPPFQGIILIYFSLALPLRRNTWETR